MMSEWDWLAKQGAVGEIPVKIQAGKRSRFLLDAEREITIESFCNLTSDRVVPGDICILKAKVIKSSTTPSSISIEINVQSVEYVHKANHRDGVVNNQNESVADREEGVEEMMSHLEAAKEHHRQQKEKNRCSNCGDIDQDTDLTVETKRGGRDLHYCPECNRLVSTEEYERWLVNNR